MDIRDIEYFATIAEYRHIGRAAAALGLTQPALSKSLRRLETLVRAQLLERTRKGVELTAAGAALLARVRPLRLALDDVIREIGELGRGHTGGIRIGVGPDTAEDLLSKACVTLLKQSSGIRAHITIASFDLLMPALEKGDLDLILSGLPVVLPDNLVQEHLYDHEFAVYAAPHHRLARRSIVTLDDLARERWALAAPAVNSAHWLYRAFESHGLPVPRAVVDLSSTALRLQIVAATDLVGFFWRQAVKRAPPEARLKRLPVRELVWKRRVGITTRKNAYHSPLLVRAMEVLRSTARDISRRNA